jgi:hypothetical protein
MTSEPVREYQVSVGELKFLLPQTQQCLASHLLLSNVASTSNLTASRC